jgi:integrase/recombinase XerC
MTLELVLQSRWNQADSRKREAARAAHDQDLERLMELVAVYFAKKSKRKADSSSLTLDLYRVGISRWLDWCSGSSEFNSSRIELLRATEDDLESWLVHLQTRGRDARAQRDSQNPRLTPGTVAAYLSSVRALYRALIWAKTTSSNPALEVNPPSDPSKKTVKGVLSVPQYNKLRKLPNDQSDDSLAARDQAILVLGGSLGLRAREMCALNLKDLDFAGKSVSVLGKGGKLRYVPLHQKDVAVLEHWLQARRSLELRGKVAGNALLVSFKHAGFGRRLHHAGARFVVNKYFKVLGVKVTGLHVLRRTTGTHLYQATRDLRVVADLLGHTNLNTAAIYAKLNNDVIYEAKDKLEALRVLD